MIQNKLAKMRIRIDTALVKEIVGILTILLSLALVYCYCFSPIRIEVTLQSPLVAGEKQDFFQLFYTRLNQSYSSKHSKLRKVTPKKNTYRFELNRKFIDTLYRGRKIRLDPTIFPGQFLLEKITIRQRGYLPFIIDSHNGFQSIKPMHDIDKMEYTTRGLIVEAAGNDPQLEMVIGTGMVRFDFRFLLKLFVGVVLGGLVILFILSLIPQKDPFIYVPVFLVFVSVLIFYTSSITRLIHLDEPVHVHAGKYYENNWIPPEICSPETRDSYSISGVSRLDNFEIIYLFAGKLGKLLTRLNVAEYQRYRYFNGLLFLILALLSLRFREYRILTLPLLMTPQVWYLFTYFNSDAFSLFVIIVISYQIIAEKSMTNTYLTGSDNEGLKLVRPVAIGLLFSLLLLIKVNYYIFIVFLFLILIKKIGFKEFPHPRRVIRRVAVIALIAAVVFGIRWGIDIGINGMDRKEKRVACRVKLSHPLYSPATPLEKRFKFKNLKDRNVPVSDLFTKYNWGWKTFLHSFGVYYIQPRAELDYYKLIMVILLFGSLYLTFSNLKQFQVDQFLLLAIVVFCSLLLLGLSLWNSWTANFQAQGRYLFPVLVMIGFLLHETLPNYNEKVINLIVLALFGLSTYSYIYIGLMHFPKL